MNALSPNVSEEIRELRQNGYVVRIQHVRNFKNVAKDTKDGFDFYLTRGEFLRAVDSKELVYFDFGNMYTAEGDETVFGNVVSPTGGFTCVTIEKDGSVVSKGKRNFAWKEQFNKKIGLKAAFGKAYFSMLSKGATND